MARLDHGAATDHILRLRDGRRLGYSVFGDPDGFPVVNCHGGLVSRNDIALADADARELGICIVSPDRPGIGLSDRRSGQDIVEWAGEDLAQLVDALGVDRFAVMGWSGGGQYALAAAYVLAERVTRAACIAGCPPLDDPQTFRELNAMDRYLSTLSMRAPWAARSYFVLVHAIATRFPGRYVATAARSLGKNEAEVVVEKGSWLAEVSAEGATDPDGAVDAYRDALRPWGFAPADLTVPVDVYQGTADTLVPEQWGHRLAEEIPDARLTLYPGEGHMIALTHRREIMQRLLPR